MRLQKIEIKNLFRRYNYNIELTNNSGIKIITGPNGYGKSTIIRLLSNFYSGNIYYFFEVPFNALTLTFANGNANSTIVSIDKIYSETELTDSETNESKELKITLRENDSIVSDIIITKTQLDALYQKHGYESNSSSFQGLRSNQLVSTDDRPDILDLIFIDSIDLLMFIRELNVLQIEDQRLFYTDNSIDKQLLQHGANLFRVNKDASELKDKISGLKNKLSELLQVKTIEAISASNSIALTQTEYSSRIELINKNIKELVVCGIAAESQLLDNHLLPDNAKMLTNILFAYEQVVVKIYEQAEEVLLLVKLIEQSDFPDKTCTLNALTGYCFTDINGVYVPAELLSSGEQHKLVMYYQLIFKTTESMLVLIDEPELSFHVLWQTTFIDEMKQLVSQKNLQMIIATHSPQIIDGKWSLTQDLYESANSTIDA